MILGNDMTNNDKLTWFRAFKKFLAKYELTLTRLISNHVKNELLFDCISPNLKEMLSESYEEEENRG